VELRVFGRRVFVPVGDVLNYTRAREVRMLIEDLDPRPGERICDVACGNGYWDHHLARGGSRVFGIDLDHGRIRQATRHHTPRGCRYVTASAEELPFPDGSFDKVLSVCALEHFRDDTRALAEIRRVLRSGGTLALSVDSMSLGDADEEYLEFHRRKFKVNNYYELDGLRDKLEAVGFGVERFRWLTTSRVSGALCRLADRHRRLSYFLYPVAAPLCVVSDRITTQTARGGHKLLVRARRTS